MKANRVEYRKAGVAESLAMHRLLDAVITGGGALDEIERLLNCRQNDAETAFELYASSVLKRSGIEKLLQENAIRQKLKILAPEGGLLARIACSAPLPKSKRKTLEAAETALNRLISIIDAMDDGTFEGDAPAYRERISINFQGCEHFVAHAAYRSAQVKLPSIKPGKRISTCYYNEVDWRALDSIASISRTLFQRCLVPNMHLSVLGINAPSRGDWDVRTRLATILKGLELPFRCRFRFDCDMHRKTVWVRFDYPPTSILPDVYMPNKEQDCTEQFSSFSAPPEALEAFALRFTCLVAAACFGSGREIEHVCLQAMDDGWKRCLIACSFERAAYVRGVLCALDSGELSSPKVRFGPDAIASAISADFLDWSSPDKRSARYTLKVALPPHDSSCPRIAASSDNRLLSKPLMRLFHAQRVSDIDTASYFGGNASLIEEARRDSNDSNMAAIVRLESIVDDLEASVAASIGQAADAESIRALYCPHPLARLAISLLDDELSVAFQAEEYLLEQTQKNAFDLAGQYGTLSAENTAAKSGATSIQGAQSIRYIRVPNALFHAHMGLSDLYQRIGDYAGAEMHADCCIALAPTTADSYYRKADILAEKQNFTQAANVLIMGLRSCVVLSDCSLLYYYLGLLFWRMKMKRESAAVHTYNASLSGEFAEKSSQVVKGLRNREDAPVIVHASPIAASREMQRLRIPLAPVDMRYQIAYAALGLAEMNALAAAAPYASALAEICRNDDIIVAACRSIQFGTAL